MDNLVGTSGNDTFTGGTAEMQAADVINGGAGTDTAKLFLDADDDSLAITAVEVLQLQASGTTGTRTLTATNVTGAQEVWSNKSSSTLVVADLQNNVTLGLLETNAALTANFKAGVVGATGTLNIATSTSGTVAAPVVVTVNDGDGALAADKFTTLAVNAVAGKSYISADGTAGATDFTAIKTSGDGFVSITGANTPFSNVVTVDLQAKAGSTLNLLTNSKDVAVTAGAGDDTIIFAANQFNTKDTVALGEGKDTLTLGDANLNAGSIADLTKAINAATGVDVLATTAATAAGTATSIQINAGLYTSINEFKVAGEAGTTLNVYGAAASGTGTAATAAVTFSGVASDGSDTLVITEQTVTGGAGGSGNGTVGMDAAAAVKVSAKLDSGSDAVNLTIGDTTSGKVTLTGGAGYDTGTGSGATDGANGNALDAREFETLNITVGNNVEFNAGTASGTIAAAADVLVGANGKITIAGKGDVDMGLVAANSTDTAFQNLTITATTLEGKLTVTTGVGNDVIKVGSKGSDVTAGAGTDQITLGAGVDVLNFAKGDSGIEGTNTITKIDVITGFKAGISGDQLNSTATATAKYTALTSTQQTAVTNAQDILAAANAAIDATSTEQWTAFTFGGKTYAVYEGNAGASASTFNTADGDLLIELVGVTVADLVSANFA